MKKRMFNFSCCPPMAENIVDVDMIGDSGANKGCGPRHIVDMLAGIKQILQQKFINTVNGK